MTLHVLQNFFCNWTRVRKKCNFTQLSQAHKLPDQCIFPRLPPLPRGTGIAQCNKTIKLPFLPKSLAPQHAKSSDKICALSMWCRAHSRTQLHVKKLTFFLNGINTFKFTCFNSPVFILIRSIILCKDRN